MPLGAFRINSLAKSQAVAAVDYGERTTGFHNVTANGNAQLSNAQYKFNTGTRGGSILLDGTGDYLSIPTQTDFGFGTGDFTAETWIRFDVTSGVRTIFDFRNNTATDSGGWLRTIGNYELRWTVNSSTVFSFTSLNGPPYNYSANTWHHIAVSRESGTTRFFFDGTQIGTYSDSNNYGTTKPLVIGADYGGTSAVDGYMDEIRISDVARYTSSFTPETTAFEPDGATLLLLHGDGPYGSTGNLHIVDDIGDLRPIDIHIQPNVTQGGTAPSISTTQSKFGGSSLRSYDNEGHCEFASPSFGSAYTIEFWFRADNLTGDQYMAGVWGGSGHGGFTWTIYLNGSTVKTYVWGGAAYIVNNVTIGTASANTWHHVAISWDGSTYRTFLDGTLGATVSSSSAPNYEKWSTTWVGTVGGTTSNFSGYIDEYRMSSTARYTASFTPSTSAFTDDANTKVLLHFDGTNGDTTTTDDYYDTTADYNQAVTFDGSSDYLSHTSSTGFTDGKQLTVSMWFRPASLHTARIYEFANALYSQAGSEVFIVSDGRIRWGGRGTSNTYVFRFDILSTGTKSYSANTWYHLLGSVDLTSTSTRHFYLNDEAITTTSDGTWSDYYNVNIDLTRNTYAIGAASDFSNKFNGDLGQIWIDDSYIDLSSESNRRKFISASGRPVDAGSDGSTPTGSQPLIYIKGDAATWNSSTQNLGSTSDFTMTGSVTDSSNEPIG